MWSIGQVSRKCVVLPLTQHLWDIKGNGDLLGRENTDERADGGEGWTEVRVEAVIL